MQQAIQRIEQAPPGQLLTYADFQVEEGQFPALAAALSRLSRKGVIERLAKGRYYKPKQTVFGKVKPSEQEIIRNLSSSGNKLRGYQSGIALYNQLGLTTQIPQEITLVTRKQRRISSIGKTKIRYVQSPMDFQESDIDKLQLLDVLRDFKKIPDRNNRKVFDILTRYIKNLKNEDIESLAQLALNYNPATRALLGALIEQIGYIDKAYKLRQSLNPLSRYKINIPEKMLPNKKAWNII
ncbi:type IV toxin-antitoxin system AbiEi family antitoxin domain-containing protein [Rufibacter psychrotolerans]|uniref:type IV toxin-antitoxin system AbiEi family antitoxin domain-containing protein n=1 Tax=Rufibacter psychrotolerans TaxID=2812556 RepID=UPI0019670722|nr:DUF6088 family protein [Rufibacter sp. SYSU D00308]